MSLIEWKDYLRYPRGRRELLLAIVMIVLAMMVFAHFVDFIEARPGARLDDPVLRLTTPIDLTWPIFLLVYGSLIGGVAALLRHPQRLVFALQLYALMVVSRIVAMYLIPLDPPANMIALRDPIVELFGTGHLLTRDLFFSGHTATLFILFLTANRRVTRIAFMLLTLVVAAAMLLQHVHYSIDVLAAFFFTYADYALLRKFRVRFPPAGQSGVRQS
jgi:hypothetical protein